jgi:hypothetical protein
MSGAAHSRPDPERARLIRCCFEWSPLWQVAEALAAATQSEELPYVERIEDQYRWSLVAHSAYPLLRIAARFLRIDHHRIFIGFRTIDDEYWVLWDDEADATPADATAVLHFDGPTSVDAIRRRVSSALGAA